MSQAAYASVYSFLTPASHLSKFFKLPETHYKIIRAADPVFDTIEEIAKAAHASEDTLAGLSFGRSSVKTLRHVLASFYLFTGVLPSLIFAIKLLFELIKGLSSQKDVRISPSKNKQFLYYETAKGAPEKWLALGAVIAKCIKAASSLCASILNQLPSFKNHNTLMLVKHCSGAIGYAFEIGYYSMAYQRAVNENQTTEKSFNHYVKKMHELALGLIEKVLQVIYDIAKLLQGLPPPWLRLPLTLTIATIGLIKVWVKTDI